MPGGRPTRLTSKIIEKICEAVRWGATYEIAARAAGVPRQFIYVWKQKGENAKSGIYREFYDALQLAEADAEVLHVKNVTQLALGGRKYTEEKIVEKPDGTIERTITTKMMLPEGQRSEWILERRFPERWAKKDGQTERLDNEDGVDDLDGALEGLSRAASEWEGSGGNQPSES